MSRTELRFLCYLYFAIMPSFSILKNLLPCRRVLRMTHVAEASSHLVGRKVPGSSGRDSMDFVSILCPWFMTSF